MAPAGAKLLPQPPRQGRAEQRFLGGQGFLPTTALDRLGRTAAADSQLAVSCHGVTGSVCDECPASSRRKTRSCRGTSSRRPVPAAVFDRTPKKVAIIAAAGVWMRLQKKKVPDDAPRASCARTIVDASEQSLPAGGGARAWSWWGRPSTTTAGNSNAAAAATNDKLSAGGEDEERPNHEEDDPIRR